MQTIIQGTVILGAMTLSGIALYLLSQKASQHSRWLLINAICGAFCQYLYLIQINTKNLDSMIAIHNACYIVKSFALIGFLFFTVDYCKFKVPTFFHRGIMIYVILLTFLLAFNGTNGIVYEAYGVQNYYGISYLQMERHFLYNAIIVSLSVLIISACVMLFIQGRKETTKLGRKRTILLGTTILFPTVGVFLKKNLFEDKIDCIIILFTLSAIHIIILIYKYGLLDTIDIAKETIVDSAKEGLIVVDVDGNIIYSNEIADKLIKIDNSLVFDIFKNDISKCQISENYYEIRRTELKEGRRLRGYMAWIFDVTDNHAYTKEVEKLKEAAEKANLAKTNFLANMSHEIRTPMNAILGFSELMMTEKNKSVLSEYAFDIKRSAQSLLHIINEVLDISKIEAGRLELVEEDYYIQSVLQDVCIIMGNLARKKNLDFITHIDNQIPYKLCGAYEELRQIITNILNNAIKYTSTGSVTLSVKSTPIMNNEIKLIISVTDTGIGMKPEDVERVFEKFSKFDTKVNREVEGTGLGMSIVKALLDQMNGTILVDSTYGMGTTIQVSIPQKVSDERPIGEVQINTRAGEDEAKKHFIINAKILIVDDNETNLKVCSAILKKYGVVPDLALSGQEALSMVKEKNYDLIFMDHMMPVMDGIETMHAIRRINDTYLKLPIIALTANAISGVREQMLMAGFEGYLPKPIDINKLEELLIDFIPDNQLKYIVDSEMDSGNQDVIARLKDNMPDINVEVGLSNCGGNIEDYISILKVVLKYGEARANDLQKMIQECDYSNYTINVHALKSTAANIGANKLSEESLRQEKRGKEKEYQQLVNNSEELIILYKQVLKEIELCLGDTQEQLIEANKDEISDEELKEILEGVVAKLHDFLIDDANNLLNEVLEFALTKEKRSSLMQAKKSIEGLNIDDAIKEIMKI